MSIRSEARRRSRSLRGWPRAVLLGLTLVVGGCSDNDPAITLRRAGVIFQRDDNDAALYAELTMPIDAGPSLLAEVARVGRVKALDLSGNTEITDEDLKELVTLDELESLDLSETNIGDAGLEHLKKLISLKELTLSNTRVTHAGLEENIPGFPALQKLVLTPSEEPEDPSNPKDPLKKKTGSERHFFTGLKLGIDLSGGANILLAVDLDKAQKMQKVLDAKTMAQMATAIMKRANPGGTHELIVRPLGENRIEVIIPRADPQTVEQILRRMLRLGSLELAFLANRRDHQGLVAKAEAPGQTDNEIRDAAGVLLGQWHPISAGETLQPNPDHLCVFQERPGDDGTPERHVLVKYETENKRVTGDHLYRVYETNDKNGQLAVGFQLNIAGSNRFSDLTGRNEPDEGFYRHLAIILDGNVFSAPRLESRISSSGVISGSFTRQEVKDLIAVLDAGALEVPLLPEPISELNISPTLAGDVRDKGIAAISVAAVAVVIFMLLYYQFPGLVAVICLVMNLVLVLGTMIFIEATFTLPGLAGLVLTIGMAVDANVLIFERIREEQIRGGSVRMAIHNGFARAFTTIIDANVTTLLVAVVLYTIGTDQVRGFAVTLFIGIIMSMFTALFVGRLLFDIWERRKHREQISMWILPGISGREFDFLGKRKIAAVVSLAVIGCGLAAVFARGVDIFDIDFRGGRAVSFQFDEDDLVRSDVRAKLVVAKPADQFDENFALEKLERIGAEAKGGSPFRLRTTVTEGADGTDTDKISDQIKDWITTAFPQGSGFSLTTMFVKAGEIRSLPGDDRTFPDGLEVTLSFESTDDLKVLRENVTAYIVDGLDPLDATPTDQVESRFAVEPTGDGVDKRATRSQAWIVRFSSNETVESVGAAIKLMQDKLNGKPRFDQVTSFDSAVAEEMKVSAMMAMLFSLVAVVGYIWFRFQRIDFGLAAVVALVHDVLIVLGGVALAGLAASKYGMEGVLGFQDFKINLPMIAAFLTIVGYSLNDTIVVFDRIREVRGKNPVLNEEMVNRSLNQTLARTLLTSLTTLMVVGILYAFGGDAIHGFAYCLVLGVVVGTYSSIFVASPALLWMMDPDSLFQKAARRVSGTTPSTRSAARRTAAG